MGVGGTGARMAGEGAEHAVLPGGQGPGSTFSDLSRRRALENNQRLQHIERTWSSVSRDPVDPTNSASERLVGLMYKIRAKTMRGFKSPDKALAHPYRAAFLRGTAGVCHLRMVI